MERDVRHSSMRVTGSSAKQYVYHVLCCLVLQVPPVASQNPVEGRRSLLGFLHEQPLSPHKGLQVILAGASEEPAKAPFGRHAC